MRLKNCVFLPCLMVSLLLFSCHDKQDKGRIETDLLLGTWRGVLKPQDIEIPFLFEVARSGERYQVILKNAEERILLDNLTIATDSIHIPMYIFDATIHARIKGNVMNGIWVKNYAEDYIVPFEAGYGKETRFSVQSSHPKVSFDGKWEVNFINGSDTTKAIGLFAQKGHELTGTFLTSTGDYRYLDGAVDGQTMKLSCFDGSHAYLFEAEMSEGSELVGEFWSGKTGHKHWTARRNDHFELPDPYTLTYMKEGYDRFEIKFPNLEGDSVELTNEKYKDKVIIVQILGTWCPNCMDETAFYVDWYDRNRDRGVEVIGLAFERKADPEYAVFRVQTMKQKLGVNYEVLIAGTTGQESRAKALPMLNEVMSFPTSVILDRRHNVRKIHTGFSGPGTGAYYREFVEEFNLFMDKLIEEQNK